ETGKKMSKRDNASSVKWLVDEGFLPAAISNYIILLDGHLTDSGYLPGHPISAWRKHTWLSAQRQIL
ncbi:MAG: hypothetical protein U9Q81_08290, partial [Pseudomonadota bacterium]|nr:hypothetical protein [Pseudomonadota bacterium]